MILAVFLLGAAISRRQLRRRQEARIQTEWGKPGVSRDMDEEILADTARYWESLRESIPVGTPLVDDITWNDLEMDAVLHALNRTETTVGAEVLYAMLRNLSESEETLACRIRRMQALTEDEAARLAVQRRLARLGKNPFHGAWAYLFHPAQRELPHQWAYVLLGALPIVLALLGCFLHPAFFVAIVPAFLVNLLVFYLTQAQWSGALASVRHLAEVFRCARHLQSIPVQGMEDMAEELRALCAKLKPLGRWDAMLDMKSIGDFAVVTEYMRIAFLLDMIALGQLMSFLRKQHEALARLYALVGELDALLSLASLRASLPFFCEAEWTEARQVQAEELAHPMVASPVRNSMDWQQNVLITGSNASGKSTFLKAMALNAIFAQTIGICFAKRFSMPRCGVMSSMALRDHLLGGESYFIIEIKSLRRILFAVEEAQNRPILCFVDEILRGTNTEERIAASAALLCYLESQNVLCMAATHDVELTRLLQGYAQYHFREEMTEEGMTFPYRLLKGPCTTRNAIRLLAQMDFPAQVVAAADDMAAHFDEVGEWKLSD